MPEARLCSQCNAVPLHTNNKSGICTKCQKSSYAAQQTARAAGEPAAANPNRAVLKKFHLVADALGFDGQQLITDFCEGWLENIKRTAAVSRD